MSIFKNFGGDYYGLVKSSKDAISTVEGLNKGFSGELVIDKLGNFGMILNLEKESTSVIAFSYNSMLAGTFVFSTGTGVSVSVNPILMGNVFTSLGHIVNNLDRVNDFKSASNISFYLGRMSRFVELKAAGIIERESVYEPLSTGFIGVDGLLPLGRGQRELIIGDRQTGKTSLALDIILNQSNFDLIFLKYRV